MKACGLTRLNMTDDDRATLQGLIEMRLGNSALQMTRHILTTDKNDSINRSFIASLPKNVKSSRNAHGRVCSVIDRVNYGAGNSMLRKLENVRCPITRGGQVARAVKHEVEYQRQYKRRSSVRLHTRHTKLKRMQNYFDSKRNRRPEVRYLKCQLDPKPATRKGKKGQLQKRQQQQLSQWSQGVAAERQHCQLQTGKIILIHCDHESLLITVMPAESRG